ncbi:hypothetical protein ONS95_009616 [Cadophora gregata]|uniref:uncharacterized protein n=1 Tax=Cadophora gregata TaxID=51156 RepID=UPI0026DC2650|nr:uncharacterized protein ONS95_009616 [Cadophora gregata]KAK0124671.1 hypothetical protein ONS95_009616 [Cadophora gregata]
MHISKMQITNTLVTLGLLSSAQASRLFVSSYSGDVATVELTDKTNGVDLKATSLSQGCKSSPSWLQYDSKTSVLYCAGEGNQTPDKAAFTSLKVAADGSLTYLSDVTTANGGVNTHSFIAGKDKYMAVAHYGGSAISIIKATDPKSLQITHAYSFVFNPPRGPDPAKPIVPFIHQVVVDPTGAFLLAPDLSGDEVHIFGLHDDGQLTDPPGQAKLLFPAGSGPRHLAFYQPDGKKGKTYVYVVMEKTNMLYGFEVTYASGAMQFKNVYTKTIFDGEELPTGSAAAEITVTPDNKFLIISSRSDNLNPPGPNSPTATDTLVTFSLDATTGIPKLLQKFSAGGSAPRSFAINRAGDRVAIALAKSNKLVILARDIKTGKFTTQLGSLDLEAGKEPNLVTSVVWEEESDPDIVVAGGAAGGGGASSSVVSGSAQITSTGSSTPLSSSSSSGEEITPTGTAGSLLPSSASSEEDTTTAQLTSTVTHSVTKSACQASSPPKTSTPTTLTRELSSMISSDELAPSNAGNSPSMSTSQLTASSPVTISAPGSVSTPVTLSTQTPTPTRFPTTTPGSQSSIVAAPSATGSSSIVSQPGYFATSVSGSASGSPPAASPSPSVSASASADSNTDISKQYSSTSVIIVSSQCTAVPSPVRTGVPQGCKNYYQVVSGDTCDGICERLNVPTKMFRELNTGVGEDCTDLEVGEWVCISA